MKKQRFSSKLLAFLMSILILAVSLPTYAFATLIDTADDANAEEQVSSAAEEISFPKSEVYVLEEDIALRTENTKHFKISDGTVKAVSYAQPVHYMDEDGNWIDIDNALTLNGNEYSAKNKQEIKFANKSGSTGTVSIKDGEYKIDFTPLNANKVSVEIENPQENNSRKFDDVKKLNSLVSTATYKNIYDGVDLEYILVGNNIKENIIVNEKQVDYVFSFEIKLNKLNAELVNNAIILTDYDTGEQVYEIPAPYMLDASGEYSDSVEYTLTQNSKWKYTLTVSASAEWINDAEREFPVKIDPTFIVNTNVTDLFIMSYDGIYYDYGSLVVGNFVGNYDTVSFLKFHDSPIEALGTKLIDVKLVLQAVGYSGSVGDETKVGVYPADADWTVNDLTGNYVVSHADRANYFDENNLVDYVTISGHGIYKWDITKLYKEWKSGEKTDCGLCLKDINLPLDGSFAENDGESVHFASSEAQDRLFPMLEITYSSTKGIEDYYSYYTVDAGAGGTGYVNAYDGNLTMVVPITTTADEILPYSVGLIYDNATGEWRNSFDETVVAESQGDITRYKWTDSDGTEHWFSPYFEYGDWGQKIWYTILSNGNKFAETSPVEYYDEDGLGLTIRIENGVVNMYDQKGNKKVFNSNGTLSYIVDTFGNERSFSYGNGKVGATYLIIEDTGLIPQLYFEYNENGNLSTVYNNQTQVKAFIYWDSNNKLSTISYVSFFEGENFLQNAIYTYDSFGMLDTVIDSNKGDRIGFSYNYNIGSSVTDIVSLTGDNSLSAAYEISYGENKTIFKDLGDDPSISADDVWTTYVFDSKGRVISTSTTDSTGNTVYGAQSYDYYDKYEEENVGPKTHNNVKNVTSYGINAPNILTNPDFVMQNGTVIGWQTLGGLVGMGATDGEFINPLMLPNSSAGKTIAKQSITHLESGSYTFSVYANMYQMNPDSLLILKVRNSQNEIVASESFQKYENSASELSSYWTREELRFDIATSGSYTVIIEFDGTSSGESVYIDNAMLENGTGASTFSIYSDGEFGLGEKTLTSNINESVTYGQQINLPTLTNLEGWAISAWVKVDGSVASANTENCSANVGIRVISGEHEQFIPVNVDYRDWQYVSAALTYDDSLTCQPNDLFVYLVNEYNIGTVHFDKITLRKVGSSADYKYNSLGNVTEIANGRGQTTTYNYNGGNLIDVTSVDSYSIASISNVYYDGNHNAECIITDYDTMEFDLSTLITRNEQGQITQTRASNSRLIDQCLVVDTTYITDTTSANYSKVDTVTDERGNVTKYYYTENGLLKGVCLNDDEGTLYDYNVYGELIKVSLAKYNTETEALEYLEYSYDSVEYEYNVHHELTSIRTNSTEYNFTYDKYGNLASITIGEDELTTSELIELVSYEYGQNNGNLTSLNYGNGMSVQYLYDNLDRVIGICYNESTEQAVIYTYGSNGQVSAAYDVQNSTVYNYYYNGEGTISREKAKKNGTTLYERVYTYDDTGKLTGVDLYCLESYSSPKNSIRYAYDSDSRLVGITNGNGQTTSYTYNIFGQVTSKTSSYTDSFTLKNSYAYYGSGREDVAGISPVVNAEIRYINGVEDGRISYTYDDRGNIISIVDEDGYITSYEYDDKNQLIRENSQRFNYTYLYQYDFSGNIRYKETRAYTTAPTNEVYSTTPNLFEVFSYNDSQWGDRITGYSISSPIQGQLLASGNMTYDAIGNPLTYYNGGTYSFVWEEGRQLASVTSGSNTYTYKYNQDGVRIEKTVGTLRYEYTVSGTRIEREKIFDGSTLKKDSYFYYDSSGIPCSAKIYVYNGTSRNEYNLILESNIQGDITDIYTADGTLLASLTYNAWGQIRGTYSSSNSTLSSLAFDIPFKYRGYYHDAETGFYYLNSRYYDPYMMRFINADGYVSTGQGLNGNNMYAYCNNNPVMGYDPTGKFTFSIDLNASFVCVGGLYGSFSVVIDDDWNFAFQKTTANVAEPSSGAYLGWIGADAGVNATLTRFDTYKQLEGWSETLTIDATGFIINDEYSDINGISLTLLDAIPAEESDGISVNYTIARTETIVSFNILEEAEKIWNRIENFFNRLK